MYMCQSASSNSQASSCLLCCNGRKLAGQALNVNSSVVLGNALQTSGNLMMTLPTKVGMHQAVLVFCFSEADMMIKLQAVLPRHMATLWTQWMRHQCIT